MSIEGFDIHVDAGATTIEIYSRPDVIVTNNNDNGWFLIQTVQVDDQGKGSVTVLPDFTAPVNIPAFSKQSFYVKMFGTRSAKFLDRHMYQGYGFVVLLGRDDGMVSPDSLP